MTDDVIVRGGTLVTMDAGFRVLSQDLWISDGVIQPLDFASGDVPEGAQEVDATDCFVLPGFVQGHVHLGQALLRGLAEDRELLSWLRERIWPLEAAHDHGSAYWSGMLGAAECLASGTTTIHEIGLVRHMDAIFESIRDSGIRAIAGKCLMDEGEGVPPALVEDAEAALAEARALHETWHGAEGGRISSAVCPRFILSCSERLWGSAAQWCQEARLPMHMHLYEHRREEEEVRAILGATQMEYLDRLGVFDTDLRIAHGVWLDAGHMEILAGRHLSVCHCPSANLKLGSGVADLQFLRAQPNVDLGIGTDGAPCSGDMDQLSEMRLAALLQQEKQGPGKVTARDVLGWATREGAKAIGLADVVGELREGLRGDVVVLDLSGLATFGPPPVAIYDRIVYAAGRDCVRTTIVDGHIVYDRGHFPHLDESALRRRPAEAHAALLSRAALS